MYVTDKREYNPYPKTREEIREAHAEEVGMLETSKRGKSFENLWTSPPVVHRYGRGGQGFVVAALAA